MPLEPHEPRVSDDGYQGEPCPGCKFLSFYNSTTGNQKRKSVDTEQKGQKLDRMDHEDRSSAGGGDQPGQK